MRAPANALQAEQGEQGWQRHLLLSPFQLLLQSGLHRDSRKVTDPAEAAGMEAGMGKGTGKGMRAGMGAGFGGGKSQEETSTVATEQS